MLNTVQNQQLQRFMQTTISFIKIQSNDIPPQLKMHRHIKFDQIKKLVKVIESKFTIYVDNNRQIILRNQEAFKYLWSQDVDDETGKKIENYFKSYRPQCDIIIDLTKSTFVYIKVYRNCIYYGEMLNDQRNGRGVLLYDSGKLYEGYFQNNELHGRGFLIIPNGSIYYGTFINNIPEGQGVYIWPNGESYAGQWLNGLKQGYGLWKGNRKDSYIGEWFEGNVEGFGQHIWCNGDVYLGESKSSLKHGYGIEQFGNGDCYKGYYQNGRPVGYGEYYWKNGVVYKGEFKNGLRDGRGEYVKNVNQINSDHYSGQYKNDKKNGHGVYRWSNGTIYKGDFANDKRQGYGEIQWNDGTFYKGEWHQGKMNGEGVMIKGSVVTKGFWKDNYFIDDKMDDLDQINSTRLPVDDSSQTMTTFNGRTYVASPKSNSLNVNVRQYQYHKSHSIQVESTRQSSQNPHFYLNKIQQQPYTLKAKKNLYKQPRSFTIESQNQTDQFEKFYSNHTQKSVSPLRLGTKKYQTQYISKERKQTSQLPRIQEIKPRSISLENHYSIKDVQRMKFIKQRNINDKHWTPVGPIQSPLSNGVRNKTTKF